MKPYAESTLRKKYKETGIDRDRLDLLFDCLHACAAFYFYLEYKDLLLVAREYCEITEEEFSRLVPILSRDDGFAFILGNGKEIWDGGPDGTVLVAKSLVTKFNRNMTKEDMKRYVELGDDYDGPSPVVWHWDDLEILRQKTAGKPLFLPPDLPDYADEYYCEETPQTKAMLRFLMTVPRFDRDVYDPDRECEFPRAEAAGYALLGFIETFKGDVAGTAGAMQKDVNYLDSLGFSFRNFNEAKKFADLYVDLSNNTRMPINRGFTPNEMSRKTARETPKEFRFGPGYTRAFESGALDPEKLKEGIMNSGDIPDSMKSALSRGIDGASPGTGARIIPGVPYVKEKTPGPNDPCPCGSGKKYKKCCGAKGSREGEGS